MVPILMIPSTNSGHQHAKLTRHTAPATSPALQVLQLRAFADQIIRVWADQ
jgi:hypothetical protein